MPSIVGLCLVRHFGLNPMSFVTVEFAEPAAFSAELDDRVKSGFVPSGEVKYDTEPVAVVLLVQPEVGCPTTTAAPGPVPVATKTLFMNVTPCVVLVVLALVK